MTKFMTECCLLNLKCRQLECSRSRKQALSVLEVKGVPPRDLNETRAPFPSVI